MWGGETELLETWTWVCLAQHVVTLKVPTGSSVPSQISTQEQVATEEYSYYQLICLANLLKVHYAAINRDYSYKKQQFATGSFKFSSYSKAEC